MKARSREASLIGIATKAGKLVFGCELTVKNVRSENKRTPVLLMLCSSDAAQNTKKRVYDCGAYYGVTVKTLKLTSAELAELTGKLHSVAVIGVTDAGFSRALLECIVSAEAAGGD